MPGLSIIIAVLAILPRRTRTSVATRTSLSKEEKHESTGNFARRTHASSSNGSIPCSHLTLCLLDRTPLPAERLFHYERERLIQEEERLQQAMLLCQGDLARLQAQIEVINLELTFLV